jgi:hypothetical protein
MVSSHHGDSGSTLGIIVHKTILKQDFLQFSPAKRHSVTASYLFITTSKLCKSHDEIGHFHILKSLGLYHLTQHLASYTAMTRNFNFNTNKFIGRRLLKTDTDLSMYLCYKCNSANHYHHHIYSSLNLYQRMNTVICYFTAKYTCVFDLGNYKIFFSVPWSHLVYY